MADEIIELESKHRVAFDLMIKIHGHEDKAYDRKYTLDLYADCLNVVRGHRYK